MCILLEIRDNGKVIAKQRLLMDGKKVANSSGKLVLPLLNAIKNHSLLCCNLTNISLGVVFMNTT